MINTLLFLFSLIIPNNTSTVIKYDTVIIHHKYYTTSFDTVRYYPVLVNWWLYKSMLDCTEKLKRTNKFTFDPDLSKYTNLLRDYRKSGYDRGHNMTAYENSCNRQGEIECFYFSNIVPQTPSLNRGAWKALENHTRDLVMKYDSVEVWCGSMGYMTKIGRVTVPERCWKILYIKKLNRHEAYIFYNDRSHSELKEHVTSLEYINNMTGFNIGE